MTAEERAAKLEQACRLTLLFHSSGPWDDMKRDTWFGITGNHEATTRNLCDHIRKTLEEVKTP